MIKAAIKIFLLTLWCALCVAVLWALYRLKKTELRNRFYNISCAGMAIIIGLRVKVEGEVSSARPLLMVSNHISYLDILVLGSKTPVRFTPKSDMETWPIIGFICRIGGCIFVDRKADKIKTVSNDIKTALVNNQVVSLFPEATTGNGIHLLPFKSSFFSLAEDKFNEEELVVQPAIISYTHIGKLPIDRSAWPLIAWYGDMTLAPHFLKLMTLGKIDATLTLLPAVTISQFGDRKKLAAYCYEQTAETLLRQKRAI